MIGYIALQTVITVAGGQLTFKQLTAHRQLALGQLRVMLKNGKLGLQPFNGCAALRYLSGNDLFL